MERQAANRKGTFESGEVAMEDKAVVGRERLSSPEARNENGGMGKEIAEPQPTILEQFAADKSNFEELENSKLPKWLHKYLLFRFNLLDRTGN